MARELPYLTSYRNVEKLFQKIATARQPDAFTHKFLSDTLGLKSTTDRPLIPLLRTLGFIDPSGTPTPAYGLLKNDAKKRGAIAAAIRRAYEPLYAADEDAHKASSEELRGLISQVAGSEAGMTTKIAGTFKALAKLANFDAPQDTEPERKEEKPPADEKERLPDRDSLRPEFHYNIQIHLPANATEETYMDIFNALRRVFR